MKRKIIFYGVIVLIVIALLAFIHYVPFWAVLTSAICLVGGWHLKSAYTNLSKKE